MSIKFVCPLYDDHKCNFSRKMETRNIILDSNYKTKIIIMLI